MFNILNSKKIISGIDEVLFHLDAAKPTNSTTEQVLKFIAETLAHKNSANEHSVQELNLEILERDKMLDNLQRELESLRVRFDLMCQATSDGLWDMELTENVELTENYPFWWSQGFRDLVGYQNTVDFPDVLGSWSNLLHPEDKQKALDAFARHLYDLSGNTPYDVEYRLKTKADGYKCFRARGANTQRKKWNPFKSFWFIKPN